MKTGIIIGLILGALLIIIIMGLAKSAKMTSEKEKELNNEKRN